MEFLTLNLFIRFLVGNTDYLLNGFYGTVVDRKL